MRARLVYEDDHLRIEIPRQYDAGELLIVIQKPTDRNPDPRFDRHVVTTYVLEDVASESDDTPSRKKYKPKKNFKPHLTLQVGQGENDKNLYYWKEGMNRLELLRDHPGKVTYNDDGGEYKGYSNSHIVTLKEWGDPNVGWDG